VSAQGTVSRAGFLKKQLVVGFRLLFAQSHAINGVGLEFLFPAIGFGDLPLLFSGAGGIAQLPIDRIALETEIMERRRPMVRTAVARMAAECGDLDRDGGRTIMAARS
jgi:hypothetical protein